MPDLFERVEAMRLKQESRQEENRRKYPDFAAFVDEFRKVFPGLKLQHVSYPDGAEWGSDPMKQIIPALGRTPIAVVPSAPWVPLSKGKR